MRILVCGGDERFVHLMKLLCEDGHEVLSYAAEKAELPQSVQRVSEVAAADITLLPVPAESGGFGALNAPFALKQQSASALVGTLPKNTVLIGGRLTPSIKARADGISEMYDIMHRPEFVVGNAAITAEAAVNLLMNASEKAVCDMKVLVIGWGRIGKLVSKKLHALGADTVVLSQNPEARALAQAVGHTTCGVLPIEVRRGFDAVINTAPAQVLDSLEGFRASCMMLELASAPGGINMAEAQLRGLNYTAAPGLPGRYAPESAARLIHSTLQSIIKEREK